MKIPYRYKGMLFLCLLLVLLPACAWRYAFSNTAEAWLDCRRLHQETARMASAAPSRIEVTSSDRELVLSGELITLLLSEAAGSSVVVCDYKPHIISEQGNLKIHAAAMTLNGPYTGILRVIHRLETQVAACKIVSLHMVAVLSPDRRERRIEATLYVEQLIQTDKL